MNRVRVPVGNLIDRSNQGGEGGDGIRCPKCHGQQFAPSGRMVKQTRRTSDSIMRERRCPHCGNEFWTSEK